MTILNLNMIYMIYGGILMMGLMTMLINNADDKADIYLDMLHQVPRVREAKRAVAALQVWGRRLVWANLQTMIMVMDFTFSRLKLQR